MQRLRGIQQAARGCHRRHGVARWDGRASDAVAFDLGLSGENRPTSPNYPGRNCRTGFSARCACAVSWLPSVSGWPSWSSFARSIGSVGGNASGAAMKQHAWMPSSAGMCLVGSRTRRKRNGRPHDHGRGCFRPAAIGVVDHGTSSHVPGGQRRRVRRRRGGLVPHGGEAGTGRTRSARFCRVGTGRRRGLPGTFHVADHRIAHHRAGTAPQSGGIVSFLRAVPTAARVAGTPAEIVGATPTANPVDGRGHAPCSPGTGWPPR